MKKALVVGASGGMGYALVNELAARGIEVVAFARGKEKLVALFQQQPNVTIYSGDVFNVEQLEKASLGVEVIFHAISFPYQEWEEKHMRCLNILIRVAQAQQAKIVLVDNIYAYGEPTTSVVTEDTTKDPQTKKGKIRLAMERTLMDSNIPSLIVHLPDLYGPNAENTILYGMLKSVVKDKKANYVGNMQVAREFLYTFDGAKAMVELALRTDTYNQNWHVPAVHTITGEQLVSILRDITGYKREVRSVSKAMIGLLAIFSPFMKEMKEMMYLTEQPVILSGEKYEKAIGTLPQTPYKKGLQETLLWLKEREQ
ncbi:SDR family NAD(P)-dependent oxidoreductase [Lysinibacillus parviboronicapiens]|uniref:SDR family NAD(P)-dependent oxidoreductase n=1 Tax=Lysinibacillus parviboronicapiens TaxID=436516 RepID=UPI000D39B85F|nr:SDR family NAD(P)-dependent oxidoreductase [Lysinibacillus parviboronicapiens]